MDRRGRAQDNIFVERLWWSVKHERYSSKKSLHHSIFTVLIKGILRTIQLWEAVSVFGLRYSR